jgi:hypothetical protein
VGVNVWKLQAWVIAGALTTGSAVAVEERAPARDEAARIREASEHSASAMDHEALRVWTYGAGRIKGADFKRAQRIARDLLASAGVSTDWRTCGQTDACQPNPVAARSVIVILSSRGGPQGPAACGTAAVDPHRLEGTVIVALPCVASVIGSLRRSDPVLASLTFGDLVGVVAAHEIGHVLGLRHSPTGVMQDQLKTADIISLRLGRLRFTSQQAAQMRASTLAASPAIVGDAGPPPPTPGKP